MSSRQYYVFAISNTSIENIKHILSCKKVPFIAKKSNILGDGGVGELLIGVVELPALSSAGTTMNFVPRPSKKRT